MVDHNHLLGTSPRGLLILILLLGSAGAATWTVGPTPGPGIDYTKIQDAINAANAGDTILVNSGTYNENVIVNKTLTLQGVDTGGGLPVVDAAGSGSAITLAANGCTLERFVARGSGSGALDAGIKASLTYSYISGLTISGNTATGNYNIGILLHYSRNSNISGNTATGNTKYGIQLYHSSGNTISGNIANGNANLGIYLYYSSANSISGNIAKDNFINGIYLAFSGSNSISGNTATGNHNIGFVLVSSSNNHISGNTANGNINSGIVFSTFPSQPSSNGNIIYLNTFDNRKRNADSDGTNYWNATTTQTYEHSGRNLTGLLGNIWSDYAGGDCDGDGIGDIPYNITSSEVDHHPIGGREAGIEVEKVADRTEAEVGDVIFYTIWVNNTTPCPLTGVRARDNLTKTVWNVGDLAPGQSYTNATSYRVEETDLPGPVTNELSANGTVESCGTEVNDLAMEAVGILYKPAIEVEKTASPSGGLPGSNLTFTLNVTNIGNVNLTEVEVTDHLPDGLVHISSTPSGTVAGRNVSWNLGLLGPGSSTSIEMNVQIQSGTPSGSLANRVNATGTTSIGDNVSAGGTCNVGVGIQAAIDAASPGDTILVYSGTYRENVNVNKQLTLRGVDTGGGLPVVNAGGSGSAITLSANGCTLQGFEARYASSFPNAGIRATSSGNTISGNNAAGNYYGIDLPHTSNNTISGNTVTGNTLHGICLPYSSGNTISGNNATGNYYGIYLFSSSNNHISGNTAADNDGNGIWIDWHSRDNSISGNNASDNDNGILIAYSSNNNISGNIASDNTYRGILIDYSSNNHISGNTANDNTRHGICLFSSSNSNTITGNTATGNTEAGISLISSGGNTATGNTIYLNTFDNTHNALSDGTNHWNATTPQTYEHEGRTLTGLLGNIWSDYDGLDCGGDGVGDMPYNITGGSGEMDHHPIGGIEADPGIEVQKIADRSEAEVGEMINYTIWVNNAGNLNLTGVRAEDNLTSTVWNVGDLAPGQNYTNTTSYYIRESDLPGPLTNEFWANGTVEFCGIEVNDSANETVSIFCIPGIAVSKTANVSSAEVGEVVEYTISVNNAGNVNLTGVLAFDNLTTDAWNIGNLAPGQNYTGRTTYRIKESDLGRDLVNNATANGIGPCGLKPCGIRVENYSLISIGTTSTPRIEVEKTANVSSAEVGDIIEYTISVNNTGNVNLTDVSASDNLTGDVWRIGPLAPGKNYTNTTVYQVKGADLPGPITNRFWANGTDPLDAEVNGSAVETVAIIYDPAIEVNKTANLTRGAPSTVLNFTIEVLNSGNADLGSVTVQDNLPEGLDYVADDSGVDFNAVENSYTWELGRLKATDSTSFNLTVHINGKRLGDLVNVVNVSGHPEYGGPVAATASAAVTAKEANISMEMTADPELAALNSIVTFTINVTNTGEMALDPVTLIDELPVGMTFISADPAPDGAGSLRWDDVCPSSLDPGESATIKLVAMVDGDATAPLVNHASASGCPEHGCNVSCCCFAEVQLPGLSVNKTAEKADYQRGEEIVYTIVVTNLADCPVYDVVVKDVFSRDVEFVSADPAPDSDGVWRFDLIPANGTVTITLVVRVPDQELEFDATSGVSGEGFVNVADDYSTTLQPYSITNRVSVTSASTAGEFSTTETVNVLADPGTELETREHGSGSYESEELVRIRTENRSISMDKDVAATYAPTTLGLYRNRTVAFSSRWTEEAWAKNRVTGTSMSESYRYATFVDRESRIFMDENQSSMKVESEFEGMGHIGFLKMPTNRSPRQVTPLFEATEDYTGSFKVVERIDEYGSAVSSEKAASGEGLVVVDKRLGESQRSYESGAGSYDSEELIETYTSYMAKDISLVHAPMSQRLTDDFSINSSMKWKEGMYSKVANTSYIGEEYTSITELDKETVARGLNEMDTLANFSGQARYRAILKDEVDFDEAYSGDYSVERKVVFSGTARYDRPHLNVTKTLDGIVEKIEPWKYNETHLPGAVNKRTVAYYTITIENDGNAALGPIYVRDLFPAGAIFEEPSSLMPTELTETSANWTLTHLAIGDVATITLQLDVTNRYPQELTNRVQVCGGYNDEWVCASNFTARELSWLSCCLNQTVSVTKAAELDGANGSVVWYRIDIANNDNVTRAATVTDHLPEGMILLDAMVPFASYDGHTVTWNLIDIGPFEKVTIPYRVTAQHPGRFVNSVLVDPRSADGPVVGPVRASSVIEVGEPAECESTACGLWSPPAWEFEHVGSRAGDLLCADLS